jgi:1,4-alpha-glucan branching enzyme
MNNFTNFRVGKLLSKKSLMKTFLLFLCIAASSMSNAQTYNVTFSVDMDNVTSAFTTPHVFGNYNGWCCADLMSDADADGTWEVTLSLPAGTYEFKYAADYWNIQENLLAGTAGTVTNSGFTNRQVIVGSSDIVLPTVCWGFGTSCAAAPVAQNVTFQVDLAGVTGFTTPTVNGDFNGWNGSANPLTQVGTTSIWQTTLPLLPGNYQYKFAYDNWAGQESLTPGASCTFTDGAYTNRTLVVGAAAQTLPVVCWGSCNNCAAPSYNTVFKVDMANVSGFGTPYVNGTFNGWCGACTPMTQVGTTTVWQATIPLEAGTYEYKFTYDGWNGQENLTPGSSCTVTNGGYTNRYLTVSNAQTLPVVCWESCLSCVAPVADVTFKVDMTNETGFGVAYVNGTFNGWCGDCNPMTDANADGIWEVTLPISAGTIEFKYTVDGWTGQENLASGGSCTQTTGAYTNRTLTVGTTDITMPVTCYGSCSSCATPSGPYNVTFKVDMNNVTDPFTTPYVNGTFNGWCGSCAPMTDANSDGIWELTVSVPNGAQEYKFTYDGWTGQESLAAGSTCTVTNFGFTNRSLNVGATTVLPVVCWNSCTSCAAPTPLVTFRVDMNNNTDPFTTPEVNGTFNNWCGNCAPMSDDNGDNIWEITIPLPAGTYEYKFSNDFWSGQESLTPGTSCTVTGGGFTNRLLTVSSSTTLPVVCWNSCSACSSATWTSVQSGNWGALSTWNQGTLPPTGADVVIASGDNVTINANTTVTSVNVQSGGVLTLNADLKITNGGTIAGQMVVNSNKILTLSGGTLNTQNSHLFLKSGANLLHGVGTPGAGGSVVGNVYIQRQGQSAYAHNFFSAPVSNASANLLGPGQHYFYNTLNGTASTADDANEPGWTTATGQMNVGQGYAAVYAGLVSFSGPVNNGTINYALAAPAAPASHFNLIGNPYPSSLSASAFLAQNGPTGSNRITGSLYFWDDDASNGAGYSAADYAVWNGAGSVGGAGNTPNGFIGVGQGFFVEAQSSNNITFSNSMRSGSQAQFFDESTIQRVRLSITSAAGDYNETLIAFIDDATESRDALYDATKLHGNNRIAFYSMLGNDELAIQGLPSLTNNRIVQLGLSSVSSDLHTINLSQLENIDGSVVVYLEDHETGTITNLRVNSSYSFMPGSMNLNERFTIRFTAPVIVSTDAATCENANGNINLSTVSSEAISYELVNSNAAVVSQGQINNGSMSIVGMYAGDYNLTLNFGGDYSFSKAVSVSGSTNATIEVSNIPSLIGTNETLNITAQSNGNIVWLLNNQVIGMGSTLNYQFTEAGIFTLTARSTQGECVNEVTNTIAVSDLSIGFSEIAQQNFNIVPNPAQSASSIIFSSNQGNEFVKIQMIDVTGKILYSNQLEVSAGAQVSLPIQNLATGIYLVSVSGDNSRLVSRLVIH